jgi:hypothetical protein
MTVRISSVEGPQDPTARVLRPNQAFSPLACFIPRFLPFSVDMIPGARASGVEDHHERQVRAMMRHNVHCEGSYHGLDTFHSLPPARPPTFGGSSRSLCCES